MWAERDDGKTPQGSAFTTPTRSYGNQRIERTHLKRVHLLGALDHRDDAARERAEERDRDQEANAWHRADSPPGATLEPAGVAPPRSEAMARLERAVVGLVDAATRVSSLANLWVKRSVSRTSYRSNVEREVRVKSDDGESP